LIDKAVTGEVAETVNRKNIEVFSLFDLCKKYLKQHSKRVYLHTSKIEKDLRHIDDMWDNFYKDSLDMNEVANKLEKKNIDAKKYIREELDWIRSALTPKDRLKYTGIKRIGREYPFQKNDRKRMLAILGAWEKNMEKLKAIDYIGVSSDLHKYIDKIKNDYRCVLVDETQDFGTTELRIVRALVEQNENDIFLCGDGKQKVSCKRQEFKLANIQIKSRDTITTNYRNSNEVVKFSNAIFQENYLQKKSTSEFEAPESKNSIKSSTIPIVLEATSFSQEVEVAYAYCLSKTINSDKRACIAICGYSLYEISKYARKHNVDFMHDEEKQKVKPVVFSDLEHTKGFEFDYVFIVNCNDNVMPDTKKPLKEQCIDLNRLYVAMTRAKVELVISFSKNTASDRSKYITLKAKYKSLYDEENYENIAKDLNIKKKFSDI
jgi:superfamily I DNA/RNA helicase